MEEIYLNRLSTFASNIKDLSDKALSLYSSSSWNNNQLEQARITVSKLTSILNRFNTELYQYFNQSVCPNADEVSILTSIQLEGEEALAELNTKVQAKKDPQPSTSNLNSFRGKLPELHLPSFKGDVLEWFQFWDQFSSNIDQRNLRDVDKLLYLKASLKGEARTVIDGLETTNDNYKIAVTTLKERYGKGVKIIDAHYSTLYKLERAEKSEDCRKTLDAIERHLRVLRSLGENTDHNHLRFLIMEKFPQDIIYEMKMKMSADTIEEMRKHLDIIISAREDAKGASESTSKEIHYTTETLHVKDNSSKKFFNNSRFNRNGNKGYKNFRPSTSTFNNCSIVRKRQHEPKMESTDETYNKRQKFTCVFCHEAHYNDKCTKFKTMSERKSRLQNRCYNCFEFGHRANLCKRKNTCPHCGTYGHHNRALCPKNLHNGQEPTKTIEM
ncbi:uncharacterized protein [Choristoneura fumiferana]|uniref:uncharacterized protein n=1 Tax=Choristoneura fumiferana TaxID=7141 RepID=UPI003D15AE36